MTIDVRPESLRAANVSIGEIVAALQMQNLSAPVGHLTGTIDERTIRLLGRADTVEEFTSLVVSEREGRIIRLGDVADVHVGVEDPRSAAHFSGEEAVGIDVKKSRGYSTTAVAESIREAVAKTRTESPNARVSMNVSEAKRRVALPKRCSSSA